MSYNLQITFLKNYYQLYNQERTHFFLLLCKICAKRLSHSSNMNEKGKETCDKENISKHDVQVSITTTVFSKMSSTRKEIEKAISKTLIKPYVESLENYNHQITPDYERSKKTKKLDMGKLKESKQQKKEYDFKDQSIIEQKTMSPDSTESANSTEEFDLPVTSQASMNKRNVSAIEEDSKNKKTKKKKVSNSDEKEAFPDSSTNLSEGIVSPLEVLKDLTYNCIKPPSTAVTGTSVFQNESNLGRIRVRNTQELCSSERSTPLLLPAPVPVNGSFVNHLTSTQISTSDHNSTNVDEFRNIHTNRAIQNIMVPCHSMASAHTSVNNSNPAQGPQIPAVQISRSLYEQVFNSLTVTPIQNSGCTYSPTLTLFSNNPSTSFSSNYVFPPSQRHPIRTNNMSNNKRISNSASFSSSSQAPSLVQANLNSNSLGPINLQQEVAAVIPALVQSTNTLNPNHRTYLIDLMQNILIGIRSLKALQKCLQTLNPQLAKQYFFENIMQLQRLFEKLAIHEEQTLNRSFIDYVLQKFRDVLKCEPLLSSLEVTCILTYRPVNVKNSNTVTNKIKLTKLQEFVFKQQIETYEYINSWIYDELSKKKQVNNHRLNQKETRTKCSKSSKASSEKDNNLIISGTDNATVIDCESDLTLQKTVLNASTDSNNYELTINSVCLKESYKMLKKTNEVASLNLIHNSVETSASNPLSNTSLITNKDNNVPFSRDTVIMEKSERSPTPRTVNAYKQVKVEASDENLNSHPKAESEINSLQELIVPIVQEDSVIKLEHSQNDSIDSVENESLNRIDVGSKEDEGSSEDNFSESTVSATEVIEFVEEKLSSIIENPSEIHNELASSDEHLVNSDGTSALLERFPFHPTGILKHESSQNSHNTATDDSSVLRLEQNFSPNLLTTSATLETHTDSAQFVSDVLKQNSVISSSETEHSIVQDSAHSTEFTIDAPSEELVIENKLKDTSRKKGILEDIVRLSQITITPLPRKTKELQTETVQDKILSNLDIDPTFENENSDENLHSSTQNSEKCRTVEEDIAVLDQDARNVVSVDEYCVEDTQDISDDCYGQNQNQTIVPEILMVQSISCDQFNKLNSTEIDCDDSDSESSSSNCSIAVLKENGCLLCDEESVFVCELCTEASYCSKMCQETHWEIVHHKTCKALKKNDEIIILD